MKSAEAEVSKHKFSSQDMPSKRTVILGWRDAMAHELIKRRSKYTPTHAILSTNSC